MKSLFLFMVFTCCLTFVSCTKNPQPRATNIDSLNTGDSMVSGTAPITPDSGDQTLPMDSASYDVDSIKNSK